MKIECKNTIFFDYQTQFALFFCTKRGHASWTRPQKFNRTFIVPLSKLYRSYNVLIFHTPYAESVLLVRNEVDNHVAVTVGHVAMGLCCADAGHGPQVGVASQILIS